MSSAEEEAAAQRRLAATLFNHVWALLDRDGRTPDEDAEMIHAAHASCFHWLQVGTPVNAARGEWQCSRVYAVVDRPEPALFHARRCLAICEEHGIGDFDIAFAYEALARAHAVAGEHTEAARWLELGRSASAAIAGDDDRALVLADLDTVPRA